MVTRTRTALTAAALAVLVGACTPTGGGDPDATAVTDTADAVPLTIGLTYIPNVQFAPFYLAEDAGYFHDAGVDVTLRHHGESEDLFGALESGEEDLVVAGGDEMMQARAQDVPVVAVATLYREYPVVLIVTQDSPIRAPADLAGRTVGVPGPFGETYFGLLAMLDGAGLTDTDVTIEHIGYTQQSALSSGHVDAVMGFVNNDVPQLSSSGVAVRSVPIGDVPLVGISIGAREELTEEQGEALTGVVSAVGRAVADIAADPRVALDASADHIPGTLAPEQEAAALATVEATVELYGQPGAGWGAQDEQTWAAMADFLLQTGMITTAVPAEEAYTNAFVTGR